MHFNLADIFESLADVVGEREALVCGDRRLTYAELEERANRLAHHLQSAGIGCGDHVGIQLQNSTEYVETMVACLKARAVPVNVNYRYVEHELRYLYDDADLVALVHGAEFDPPFDGIRLGTGADYEAALAAASSRRDFDERSPDDLYVIYTGGTTGMPTGVMWRQEDLFFAGLGGGHPGGEPLRPPGAV